MGLIEEATENMRNLLKAVDEFIAHYKEIETEILELEAKNQQLRARITQLLRFQKP